MSRYTSPHDLPWFADPGSNMDGSPIVSRHQESEYNPDNLDMMVAYFADVPLTPEQEWTRKYHDLVAHGQLALDFDLRDLAMFSDLGASNA